MRKAEYLGLAQEMQIGEDLANIKENSKIMHNVLLEVDGRTTQIDLLYICERGLFVIESKNYKNTVINGDTDHKMWQKWTSLGFKKFYNPVMQNDTHIQAIGRLFGLSDPYNLCSSVVVFPDTTDISSIQDSKVLNLSALKQHILNTATKKPLTEELIQLIYDSIKENNKSSVKSATERHDKSMNDMKSRFIKAV